MDIKDVKTAELVKKYNFKFSKSLGQNFLIDDSVPRDIVAGAEVNSEDLVIEIVPGVGTLTAQLLKKAKKVVAIELDNDLIPILEQELGDNPNFTLIHNDALKVDFNEVIGEEKNGYRTHCQDQAKYFFLYLSFPAGLFLHSVRFRIYFQIL